MKRYAIWDKQSNIYTPVGEELTAEQWLSRYGFLRNPAAVPVVAAGLINGAFCGELSQMKTMYENMGADFSSAATSEELLMAIEAYEDLLNTPSAEPTAEERIAAALEYQNLLTM
jgi:hypothetical protein